VTSSFTIRPVRPADVPAVVAMVHELAAYERAPEQCHLTEDLPGAQHGQCFFPDARHLARDAHLALQDQIHLIAHVTVLKDVGAGGVGLFVRDRRHASQGTILQAREQLDSA